MASMCSEAAAEESAWPALGHSHKDRGWELKTSSLAGPVGPEELDTPHPPSVLVSTPLALWAPPGATVCWFLGDQVAHDWREVQSWSGRPEKWYRESGGKAEKGFNSLP